MHLVGVVMHGIKILVVSVNAARVVEGCGVFAGEALGNVIGVAAGRAFFELDDVIPGVAEVIFVHNLLAILSKDSADHRLIRPLVVFPVEGWLRREDVVSEGVAKRVSRELSFWKHEEVVEMRIGPIKYVLNDEVQIVQRQPAVNFDRRQIFGSLSKRVILRISCPGRYRPSDLGIGEGYQLKCRQSKCGADKGRSEIWKVIEISSSRDLLLESHVCERSQYMCQVALFVELEAKPGKEAEVEAFLKQGVALVRQEPKTVAWFAFRMGPNRFGIFDAFADESGREAHLSGKVAAALMEKAPQLLAKPPEIRKFDVLADKLPN
jgi:quinol monooxygenase YgiN